MELTPSKPRLRRIAAVVNAAAGSVGPGAAATLQKLVADHGYDLSMATPTPIEIEEAVRDAVASAPDVVLVLAGDGTARLACELAGPDGPLVAPLPGGTLNMLPHAIYGSRSWQAALAEILKNGVAREVSGGRVGGHAFYVAAILGAPALWGHAREAVRAGHFVEAARRSAHALRRAFTGELSYSLDRRAERKAEALVLISPLVSAVLQDEAGLEAAGVGVHNASEAFRLAFNGLLGDWRRDPEVNVEICARGLARARHRIPCILDGEIQRMPRGVEFTFEPKAFRTLAPAAAPP